MALPPASKVNPLVVSLLNRKQIESRTESTALRHQTKGVNNPGVTMAKPNYAFEKKQRDQAKKKKQEEKRQKKLSKPDAPQAEGDEASTE